MARNRHLTVILLLRTTILLLWTPLALVYSVHSIYHGARHFIDDKSHATCTIEDEADPCHRRIVHHEIDVKCSHQSHLVDVDEDCDCCQGFLTHTWRLTPSSSWKSTFMKIADTPLRYGHINIAQRIFALSNRGPPII